MHVAKPYRSSGATPLISAENSACAKGSTGLCLIVALAGFAPRKLPFLQFLEGLTGLLTNPPPQFGQTLCNTFSTQDAQNVHS